VKYPKILFIIITIGLFFNSCSVLSQLLENYGDNEGWVDDDTYRIIADGKSANTRDIDEKLKSSESAAVKKAQLIILKKFNILETEYSDINNNPTNIALVEELKAIILTGKIIEKNYSLNNEECSIVYEIRSKGLKEKVEAAK